MPQAHTVEIPARWPLVSQLQSRSSLPLVKDARLINCFAEFDPQDKAHWVYKRFGYGTPSAYLYTGGIGNGMYVHPRTSIVAYADAAGGLGNTSGNLYWNGVNVAPITYPTSPAFTPCWFETVTSNPQTVAVSTGAQGWLINTATGIATQIAGGYPGATVPGWAYLDGTLYTMDTNGNILGSNLNDATTWNALNTIQASSNADAGVALTKHLSYVVAFKQYTTQIFFDAGNSTGSPLSPVPDAQLPLGCAAQYSVAQIDNSILWLTSNQTFSPQIVQMDNLAPRIVSTPAIDRILDSALWGPNFVGSVYLPQTNVYSWTLKHAGHRLYILVLVLSNLTLVYDLDQKLWYIWTDANGNYWPIIGTGYLPPNNSIKAVHYGMHLTNGNIYPLDTADIYPSDAGSIVPVDIYTPNMDFGTDRRKYLRTIYFNGDKVSAFLQVRYSDDDFNNFSNPRSVDLSSDKPRLPNCGTFRRRRAYHLRHRANTALRLTSMDLQMDLGTL